MFNYNTVIMKNKKIKAIPSILLITIFTLINIACASPLTVYQGDQVRNLPSFNELNLAISADVYLKQGDEQKVEIQASERLLGLIETEVKGDALIIKWTRNNVHHSENIKIYITMKEVNALRISGSGDITADGLISTTDLSLKISGSGDIKMSNVKAEKVSAHISGSADISISGGNSLDELDVAISGSGDVKADGIPAKKVSISVSGSGDCKVNAIETLKARLAGSGDIYYKGNALIDGKVAGSGSIRSIN